LLRRNTFSQLLDNTKLSRIDTSIMTVDHIFSILHDLVAVFILLERDTSIFFIFVLPAMLIVGDEPLAQTTTLSLFVTARKPCIVPLLLLLVVCLPKGCNIRDLS
jgi:hypothetical protein